MGLVDEAAALARAAHASQRRKGARGEPYVTHLESVAQRLAAAGVSDEVTLAVAWLHDLLEDQPAHGGALRRFPAEVVETVEVLTERKLDAAGQKRSKRERVHDYHVALAAETAAARRARAVSCADKIDNVESLLRSEQAGEQLLSKLTTRPGEHLPQLRALRDIYAGHVPEALLVAFDDAAGRFARYFAAWLEGRAVAIAASAHQGQVDRAGAPYIMHPLRLMMRAGTAAERMVAVLHDVLEDSAWTAAELESEGFPPEVMAALARLTKRAGEGYHDFITRVLEDALAARVKLYDLEDNMDARRLPALGERDHERLAKYHAARARILAALAR